MLRGKLSRKNKPPIGGMVYTLHKRCLVKVVMAYSLIRTWWLIPLTEWAVSLALSGLTLLLPLVTWDLAYLANL